jgi:hypothetical protein
MRLPVHDSCSEENAVSQEKDEDPSVHGVIRNELPVRPLRGDATLNGDPDEFLARLRAEQAELARRKMDEIFDGAESSDVQRSRTKSRITSIIRA